MSDREREAVAARLWAVLLSEVRAVVRRWDGLPRNVALLVPSEFPPMPGGSRYAVELALAPTLGPPEELTVRRVTLPLVWTGAVSAPTLGERVPCPPWDPDRADPDRAELMPALGLGDHPTPWTVAPWPLVGAGLPEAGRSGFAVRDGHGMPVLETSSAPVAARVAAAVNTERRPGPDWAGPRWSHEGPVMWSQGDPHASVMTHAAGLARELCAELNARELAALPVVAATQQRADDVVAELRRQIGALERQLAAARERSAP